MNESKNLVSDLQKCDCNVTDVLAEQSLSDDQQNNEDVRVVEFGSFCFLLITIDSSTFFSFLPTGQERGVTEEQFDAVAAMLKQVRLASYYRDGQTGPEEFVSFGEDSFHLSLASFLVSKGILRKKWLKRHKNFLIANSKNPNEPARWKIMVDDDYSIMESYCDGSLECFFLYLLDFDPDDEVRMSALYERFSESAKHAKYIIFPYSTDSEEVEEGCGLMAQFLRSVKETITFWKLFTTIGNVIG